MVLDLINYAYNHIRFYYNVEPFIFLIIYIVATPSYYYGAIVATLDVFKFKKNLKVRGEKFSLHELLLRKKFLEGYVINRLSWIAPYVYVLIYGENLPIKFYILLLLWSFISGCLLLHNIKHKNVIKV